MWRKEPLLKQGETSSEAQCLVALCLGAERGERRVLLLPLTCPDTLVKATVGITKVPPLVESPKLPPPLFSVNGVERKVRNRFCSTNAPSLL